MTALYQRRPVTVEACQWTGGNAVDMTAFAGPAFTVLDEQDRANSDDPEATASLFDGTEWRRHLMYTGDWAVREWPATSRPARRSRSAPRCDNSRCRQRRGNARRRPAPLPAAPAPRS